MDAAEPALVITAAELERTAPLPPARRPEPPALPRQRPAVRTSRQAVAALVLALSSLPFFGLLILCARWPAFPNRGALFSFPIIGLLTGFIAVLLGSLALGAIGKARLKGTVLAVGGVLLGLGDMLGWLAALAVLYGGTVAPRHGLTEFRADLTALDNLAPAINRAMRANVMIESQGGRGLLRGVALGSGVILKRDEGELLILTNRHVIDPDFEGEVAGKDRAQLRDLTPKVQLVDESIHPGEVVWVAPDGIDLALVRVACRSAEARATLWQLGRPRTPVGGNVFAIGNPQGLGWTHTQGIVSQYRIQDQGRWEVPAIQTQTAISPGNSGGGLYDQGGYLIGINTWAQDKRVSEGLNFAISLEILSKLRPPFLDLQAGSEGPKAP
jgi:S1-C subfamily serine protease